MATFPSVDLTKFDITKLDLPKFDLPKFDLPKFDLPKVDLPKVDLPDGERVIGFARDAAYLGIGLAVLGVQQAQERSRELVATVKSGVDQLRDALV